MRDEKIIESEALITLHPKENQSVTLKIRDGGLHDIR